MKHGQQHTLVRLLSIAGIVYGTASLSLLTSAQSTWGTNYVWDYVGVRPVTNTGSTSTPVITTTSTETLLQSTNSLSRPTTTFSSETYTTSSQTGGSSTLYDKLTQNKDLLLTELQKSYTAVQDTIGAKLTPLTQTASYKSLLCLGVVDAQTTIDEISAERTSIEKRILQGYIDLYSDISKIQQQQKLGLLSASDYKTDSQRIELALSTYISTYNTLIQARKQTSITHADSLIKEINEYTAVNTEMLQGIGGTITLIDRIQDNNKIVSALLNQFTNLYLGTENSDEWFTTQKDEAINTLRDTFGTIIKNESRGRNLYPSLTTSMLTYQQDLLRLFELDVNNTTNNLLTKWFDTKRYDETQTLINRINDTVYDDEGKISCDMIATSTITINDLAQTIIKNLITIQQSLNAGLNQINTTDTGMIYKNIVRTQYETVYNTIIPSYKNRFQSYIDQQKAFVNQTSRNQREERVDLKAQFTGDNNEQGLIQHSMTLYEQSIDTSLSDDIKNTLAQYGYAVSEKNYQSSIPVTTPSTNSTTTPPQSSFTDSDNPFVKLLKDLSTRFNSDEEYNAFMTMISSRVEEMLNLPSTSLNSRVILEQIREAVRQITH